MFTDPECQQLYVKMTAYARSYHPPKQPADCVRPVIAYNAFSHWEILVAGVWRRATLPEVRRVLRNEFALRGEAIDRALGSLLGPAAKPKLDLDCQSMLDALRLDFRDKVVLDWLATTPGLFGLSVEGLRHEFTQTHPGFEVGREIFRRIYEA